MSDYRKQIKHHQNEAARIRKELPALEETAREAIKRFEMSRLGRPIWPEQAVRPRDIALEKLGNHQEEIKHLTKLADWEEGHREAPTAMKKARKDMETAQGEALELESKRRRIVDKLAELQASQQAEAESAEAEKRAAADEYAEALTAGNEAVATRAKGILESIANKLEALRHGAGSVEYTIQALTQQLEKLDGLTDEAKQKQEQARKDLLHAARYIWSARLEKAAHEVVRLSAHVVAAERAMGWRWSVTDDVSIPLLAPTGSKILGKRDVAEISSRLDLSAITNI